jgi:hypothetical protein
MSLDTIKIVIGLNPKKIIGFHIKTKLYKTSSCTIRPKVNIKIHHEFIKELDQSNLNQIVDHHYLHISIKAQFHQKS